MEITEDSVRFHRHDLVYPATYPGETTDNTLASYPATYSPDGHITINGCPLALFPQEDGKIVMCGNYIEIKILKDWKIEINIKTDMNDIDTLKQKIIDDLSDIRDKDILEYIAKRMGVHADVARSGKPFLFDPESGCYANDETIAAIEENMSEEGEVFTDFDSFMQSLDLKPISCTSKS